MINQESPLEALVTQAASLERDGDLEGAVAAWGEMRRRFPHHFRGYLGAGDALKRLGRASEAAAVLAEGIDRFPQNERLALAHAGARLEAGDVTRARELWRDLRRRYPANVGSFTGGGLAARRAAAFEEADETYREGMDRFPENPTLAADYAWSAEERGDMTEAARRWDAVRSAFPELREGHVRRGLCLRAAGRYEEAERALDEALARFPDDDAALLEHAWLRHARGDWPEALRRWERILKRDPHRHVPRRFAAQALLELGRHAEAASVLAPAARMHPEDPDIAILNGWIATRSGEHKKAEPLWRDAKNRFPERSEVHHGWAVTLRETNRLDEAEVTLAAATAQFPADEGIARDWAQLPERSLKWPIAVSRWQTVAARFPDSIESHRGLANSLVGAGDWAEADAVFRAATKRFPDDVGIATAAADAAGKALNWPQALEWWSEIKARFPTHEVGYLGYGRSLRDCGRLQDAAAELRRATERFPDDLGLELEHALTVSALRDWPAALALWEALQSRYPLHDGVRASITHMVGQASIDQGVQGQAAFQIPDALLQSTNVDGKPRSAEDPAALLKRFESLGDSCEFGMVQRLHHVEQMTLLRWALTAPRDLINALNARFDGVGSPEHTEITVVGDEYRTHDRRYGMHSHTFTAPAAEPIETFAPEQCRRIQWLRRKLIDSLTTAARVFVYTAGNGISDADARALYAALLRYSPDNKLLCIRVADEQHPAGTVDLVEGAFFAGYLDKFSTVDISVHVWLTLCHRVAERLGA